MEAKWQGRVSTSLTKARPDQMWSLFKDFFNLHLWFPGLATCYGIHGTNGEPGCIRYSAGFSIPSTDGSNGNRPASWAKERLIAVDDVERSMSYEIVDSNIGFQSYVSTVKISPAWKADCGDGGDGCVIEWSFCVYPVEGMMLDDLVRKYERGLELMSKKMEEAVQAGRQKGLRGVV